MVFSTLNLLKRHIKCYNMNIWGFNARVRTPNFRTPFIRLEPRETLCDVAGGKAPVGAESVAVATAAAAVCSSLETPNGTHGTMAFHHWYPWYPKNGWQIPWITSNHKTHCQYCPNSHSVTTYIYLPYITCQIERFRNGLGFVRPQKSKSSLILLAILLGPVRIC